MRGLMMDYPLTITHVLERAGQLFPAKQVITRTAAGLHRLAYADLYRRDISSPVPRPLAGEGSELGVLV